MKKEIKTIWFNWDQQTYEINYADGSVKTTDLLSRCENKWISHCWVLPVPEMHGMKFYRKETGR